MNGNAQFSGDLINTGINTIYSSTTRQFLTGFSGSGITDVYVAYNGNAAAGSGTGMVMSTWGGALSSVNGVALSNTNSALTFQTTNGGTTAEQMRILNNGNVGIGTTTPQATLDVSNSSGSAFRVAPTASEVDYLQITGGISGTPGVATLSAQGSDADVSLALVPQGGGFVNVNGHIETHGTAPTITTCGTSPSVTGNDNTFSISIGSGTVTACTINFNHYWQHIPVCNVSPGYNATGYVSGSSNTAITIKLSANGGSQSVG